MKTQQIDWRKYRKSTHLASADLDVMETDNLPLIFTIAKIEYLENVDVSGTKKNGVFATFKEPVKPLLLNSTNLKTLADLAKGKGIKGKDAYIISNYIDFTIQLYVDRNVKLMGQIVDGIRIMPKFPNLAPLPAFTEEMFEKAKAKNVSIEQIKKHYTVSTEIEKLYGAKN
jgi:hypothetical protein